MTIDPTARNSDCQFCSVFSQQSGTGEVLAPRDRILPVVQSLGLYSVTRVIDCASQVPIVALLDRAVEPLG
jgi:hypothetical protein